MNKESDEIEKGRYQLRYRGTECLNCKHPLDISDRFCPYCSQANSVKKLTLKDYFEEFFANVFSYDSKLLLTLSALILRPGKITKDYINGKRVSYTNPFRFLMSLAIIYFVFVNFNLSPSFSELDKYGSDQDGRFFNEDGRLISGKAIEDLQDDTNNIIKIDDGTSSLDLMQEIAKRDSIILNNPKKYLSTLDTLSLFKEFWKKRSFFDPLITHNKKLDYSEIIAKYDLPDSRINVNAYNSAVSFLRFKQRPGAFISSIVAKLPLVIFFFLPVFTIFLWLVYIRKNYSYTDHLIFSFHNQSLLFILLIINALINSVFTISHIWIFILIFVVYLYKAMRNFYQQGRFKTIVKYVILNFIFIILAMFFITILTTTSMFTY